MYRQIGDPALRAKIRTEVGPPIEEGFRMLQVAVGLDAGWSAPMAYLNLMARVKSALVDDPAESDRLIAQADEWVGKALQARKARPEQQSAVRIDADGPPPAAIPAVIPPPPPPPPPPGGFRGHGDGAGSNTEWGRRLRRLFDANRDRGVPPPPPAPPPAK
jgi:hypothetical protein